MSGFMPSTQLGEFSNNCARSFSAYMRSVFGADLAFLKILFGFVFIWFLLAQLFAVLIPDTTTTLAENSSQYLSYALRNGQFYMMFVLLIIPLKLLQASSNTAKGESILPYLKERARLWLAGSKTEVFGIPAYFVLAVVVFALYLFSYSTIKTRIPNMIPYVWDESFQKLDRAIFFGKDPWQYFAFLYEHPRIIQVMDFIYDFWAVLLVSAWFFSMRYGGKNKARRYQFVLALLLSWFVGGNILATLLSSGGPVYFEALTGLPSTYSEQMALLFAINAETPLRAFEYQEMLWNIYESPSVGLGGISAMPSMHCASAFLMFLMFGRTALSRILLGGFFLLIFISSFVLAWHYAVDGLFVLPVTFGLWKLSGWVVGKAGYTDD